MEDTGGEKASVLFSAEALLLILTSVFDFTVTGRIAFTTLFLNDHLAGTEIKGKEKENGDKSKQYPAVKLKESFFLQEYFIEYKTYRNNNAYINYIWYHHFFDFMMFRISFSSAFESFCSLAK
jgi:hypothetical protein